ncbi:MAG: hypothetical protein U0636_12430 [Phycisphaerales bacterium]
MSELLRSMMAWIGYHSWVLTPLALMAAVAAAVAACGAWRQGSQLGRLVGCAGVAVCLGIAALALWCRDTAYGTWQLQRAGMTERERTSDAAFELSWWAGVPGMTDWVRDCAAADALSASSVRGNLHKRLGWGLPNGETASDLPLREAVLDFAQLHLRKALQNPDTSAMQAAWFSVRRMSRAGDPDDRPAVFGAKIAIQIPDLASTGEIVSPMSEVLYGALIQRVEWRVHEGPWHAAAFQPVAQEIRPLSHHAETELARVPNDPGLEVRVSGQVVLSMARLASTRTVPFVWQKLVPGTPVPLFRERDTGVPSDHALWRSAPTLRP